MEQNIETKDVQRTEYLDKNGLDMLWAKVKENTNNQVEVERNRAVAKENSIIDTKADKSVLGNYVLTTALAEYAKKTDIPEVDTSDFVSKTTTDAQIINSTLGVVGEDKIIKIVNSIADEDPASATLTYNWLEFYGSDKSIIEANSSDTDLGKSCIRIEATPTNPSIALLRWYGNDSLFHDTLIITNEGISNADNNANHVYATDGSIADLTQYAKKSEITAGGNVDDVQVNGVSVVENKIANIKPATKENLGVVKVGDGLNVTDGIISVDKSSLIDLLSYGVEWDTTVADPACTRIGNMSYHKSLPIQSQYKGCLVKNGKVNYYLDPNDWSKKADGTPSVLDGTDGDVMVHIPNFYGKSVPKQKEVVEKATTLLSDLNPIYKEKKETEQRFAKIEETINRMESTVTNFINSFRNGQGNSNTAQ